jgi:RNA polymerase sigma-70 factor (ECF subfamily)
VNTERARFEVEPYIEYLKLLARLQATVRIKVKLDTSDVIQQTLLRVDAKREEFRGHSEEEWVGWLRTILANTLTELYGAIDTKDCDKVREQPIQSSLEDSASGIKECFTVQQTTRSHKGSRYEQLILLAAALAQLPFDQREAVELHHLMGLTIAEVGQRMDKTRLDAMGLIFLGLKQLREILSNEGR